jgi:hypothetical protein
MRTLDWTVRSVACFEGSVSAARGCWSRSSRPVVAGTLVELEDGSRWSCGEIYVEVGRTAWRVAIHTRRHSTGIRRNKQVVFGVWSSMYLDSVSPGYSDGRGWADCLALVMSRGGWMVNERLERRLRRSIERRMSAAATVVIV